MFTQRSLRQIVLRPVKQLRERRSIVRRQGKEHGVALPFGGGNFSRIARIDNASLLANVIFLELFPRRPATGCLRIYCRQHDEHRYPPAQHSHHALLMVRVETTATENT